MPGFEQKQNQRQSQQQSIILSERQQLGLKLLAMPGLKLEETVQQELLKNPMLDEQSPEDFPQSTPDTADDAVAGDGSDVMDAAFTGTGNLSQPHSGEDRKLEFLSNLPAPKPTLRDLLLSEAENSDIPEQLQLPVFEIISSIDPNGFLTVPLADLAMSMPDDAEVGIDDIKAALEIVRDLAPAEIWIGYRSDFFKQQLRDIGRLTPEFNALCDELELLPDGIDGAELKKHFIPELALKLNVSPAELEKMLEVIQEFKVNCLPEFEPSESVAVYPDLEISMSPEGKLIVSTLRENQHRIKINPAYEKFANDRTLSPEDQKYFSEKFARAKNFIQALAMRESTLERLGNLIVERQGNFFSDGVSGLKSFTMSEAADLLGVNPSTVTRAVEEKYVRTPLGTFPLRYFFPGSSGKTDSGEHSREAVMAEIKKIIDNENPALPFSDDRIAEMLKEQGMSVERRTVAKYRTILKLPSASKRKNFRY